MGFIKYLLLLCYIFSNYCSVVNSDISFAKEYFVSTKGSDEWDGTNSENIPFTNTGPWQTIQHAITKLRQLRPYHPGPKDHVTINIMAGIYFQSSQLNLNGGDSYLDIVAYNDEEVSISGGLPVNLTWNIKDSISSARFVGSCPSEVFHGDYRLLPARNPNIEWGKNKNIALEPYHIITDLLEETDTCQRQSNRYSQSCPNIDRNGFILQDEVDENWENLDQTQVVIFHQWIAEYAKIANITNLGDGRKKLLFQEPLKHAPIGTYNIAGGWRFLPFNNIALLDTPGEYVCIEDQENNEAIFSFIPPASDDENSPLIFSNLEQMLIISRATNINLKGIKFQHTSQGGKDGYRFGSESNIRILNCMDIIIEQCEFSNIGSIGLYLKNSSRILVQDNAFFDIGYVGIYMMYNDEVKDAMEHVMIRNNQFNGCGISRFWQPGCIITGGSFNISVVNNDLTNVPNHLLAVRGIYPYGDRYWIDNGITEPTRENYIFHIEFNHFHDYGLGILSDYGAVYIGGQPKHNCITSTEEIVRKYCFSYIHIYNNLINDARSFTNGGTFLYSDAGSCKNTFENNIMYGNGGLGLYHHCGLENVSKNNIIHRTSNSSNYPIPKLVGGCERTGGLHQSYTNYRNIYFLDNADDLSFSRPADRFYDGTPEFHHNLYWSLKKDDISVAMFPDKKTWEEWKINGNDTASLWEDPKFHDPQSRIYQLGDDSPAWNLGIQQIQLDNFGIQTEKCKYCKI